MLPACRTWDGGAKTPDCCFLCGKMPTVSHMMYIVTAAEKTTETACNLCEYHTRRGQKNREQLCVLVRDAARRRLMELAETNAETNSLQSQTEAVTNGAPVEQPDGAHHQEDTPGTTEGLDAAVGAGLSV